jgi:hypothetical protein
MKRGHVLAVALLLGLAAMLGTYAASRSAGLAGPSASAAASASDASIARRTAALAHAEQVLRRERARRPPALPALPAAAAAPSQRVVFVRPRPVVVTTHSSHGDDHEGVEHESEGGDD